MNEDQVVQFDRYFFGKDGLHYILSKESFYHLSKSCACMMLYARAGILTGLLR
jgi:hypothetical protein